ncbi:hypothetical protein TWF730_007553 [Orbilia blumenaviensis]|uniref:Uncharacterized protein n=1 Tax=Orbilia blumenaviensis TaxID=1796055 RepID=A0AAV9V9W7_9PEZI
MELFSRATLVAILVQVLYMVSVEAVPFPANRNSTVQSVHYRAPRTSQVALSDRGITTLLDLPILIPTPFASPATQAKLKWPAGYRPLKASYSMQYSQPSLTTEVMSQPREQSSSITNLTSQPIAGSATRVILKTRSGSTHKTTSRLTLHIHATRTPILTARLSIPNSKTVYTQPTSLVPASANIPVRYVHRIPRVAGLQQRRILPRVYVTEVVSRTVTLPVHVVTKYITDHQSSLPTPIVTAVPADPLSSTLTLSLRPVLSGVLAINSSTLSHKRTRTVSRFFSALPTKTLNPSKTTSKPKLRWTHRPTKTATATSRIRDNPRCNGLYRNETNRSSGERYTAYYYFDYDFAVHHVNNYCRDIQSLPDDLNQNGIQLVRIGAEKDRNGFTLGVYWPAHLRGTKPQTEICIYYFKSLILDGCDGNDPNNPLNWKGGGTVYAVDQDGTYRRQIYYTIEPTRRRNYLIRERKAQCFKRVRSNKARIFVRGVGWAGDSGLADMRGDIINSCGSILDYWQTKEIITGKESLYEWGLDLLISANYEGCFLDIVKRKSGLEVKCALLSEFGEVPWETLNI